MAKIKFKEYKNSNEVLYRDYDFEDGVIPVTGGGRFEIDSNVSKPGHNYLVYTPGNDISTYDASFNIGLSRKSKPNIESWVYLSQDISAAGVCICQQENIKGSFTKGYSAIVSNSTSVQFIVNKDTFSVILEEDDTLVILHDTWYKVQLYIDSSDNIVAKLYDEDELLLSTLTATETSYTSGSYGIVSALQTNNFDDISLKVLGGKFKKVIQKINWRNRRKK